MIIYRVADGTAWTKDAMESRTLTSFHAQAVREPDERKVPEEPNVQFTSEFAISGISESKHG